MPSIEDRGHVEGDSDGDMFERSLGKCDALEALDVSGCWGITDAGLTAVLKSCRRLKSLKIDSCDSYAGNQERKREREVIS